MRPRRRTRVRSTVLAVCACLAASGVVAAAEKVPLNLLAMGGGETRHALLVDKAAEKVFLYEENGGGAPRLVRAWNATTGQRGGDKVSRGDLKTPEGIYFFTRVIEDAKLPAKYGVRALVMDYPNLFDRRQGRTGDGIWLHGTDEIIRPLTPMKTRGCVVVTNQDMLDISGRVVLRSTPIIVDQAIERVTLEEWRRQRAEVLELLDRWAEAWRTKDHATYGRAYAPGFRADGKKRAGWIAHKRKVAAAAGRIALELGAPTILRRGDEAIVRLGQLYASDLVADFGEKIVWLERGQAGWQIVSESWRRAAPPKAAAQRLAALRGGGAPPPPARVAPTPIPPPAPVLVADDAPPAVLIADSAAAPPPLPPTDFGLPDSEPTATVGGDEDEAVGDRGGEGEPWRGWASVSLLEPVEAATPPPAPRPAVVAPMPTPTPEPRPAEAAARRRAPLTVHSLVADAGRGYVNVNFRLEATPHRSQPLRGSLVVVVQLETSAGTRYLAWPFGGRLVAGAPVAPLQGDSYGIRRFKDVEAKLGGLAPDANLAGVRIHVYDRAGREIARHELGH